MTGATAVLDKARRIADEVLFPNSLRVDGADRVPTEHLDLLAREGLYGVAAPPEFGGLDTEDPAQANAIVEILASGCLATTFVWMQHHGAVRAATHSDRPGVRETWLKPLSRGERRAGIAYAAVRPGPASVRATAVPGGYVFDGEAPWVTGWDMIDTVHAAARDDSDMVVYALLDARTGPTMTVERLDLVAVNASRTVLLRFDGHFVPEERIVRTVPHAEVLAVDPAGLRLNGSLSLGLVDRCRRLIGPSRLDRELEAARAQLDAATVDRLPAARAAASELALRAAATLAVATGARAVLRDQHAQRLVREATFLLVFGSRPAIRDALLERLYGISVG